MKNLPLLWTLRMIATTPFLNYLLLPFFLILVLTPPGTRSDSYQKRLENPKTSQQYMDRAHSLMGKSSTKQDAQKALSDCQIAEKLTRKKLYLGYSDTLFCQGLAHAHLGNGFLARKLANQALAERRRGGHEKLAEIYEPLYKKWLEEAEAKQLTSS